MRKINLLHIIACLPLGGAENVLYTLARNYDRNRFNPIFCCLDDEGYLAEKIREEGFTVYCLRTARFRYRYRQMFNLYKLLKKERIDIVHTHLYKSDFWGRLIAFIAGVPVICKTEHTVRQPMILGVWDKIRSPFYNITRLLGMNMFLDRVTDRIIYRTEYARETFFGKKFNPTKHYVITGGIARSRLIISESRDVLRNKLGFSLDDFIIIIVGRLIERKGHKYLFEAFSRLTTRYPKMKLLVVGGVCSSEGSLRGVEKIKKMAVRLNIANKTFFTGRVENVPEYIKMSDVLVLPSWREAMGQVFLEAMYLGVPVIGGDDGGITDVIEDGISGYLVRIKDSEAVGNAILKIINEPEKTKKIVENAKDRFNKIFSEEIFTKKYEEIYMSLLEKDNRRMCKLKIAFIVDGFPAISETFILNQITELIDSGHDINIFARFNPKENKFHSDIEKYSLMNKVYYFNIPNNKIRRVINVVCLLLINFHKDPIKIIRALNIFRYGKIALSLELLFYLIPFLNKKFAIVHCHFGPNGIIGAHLKGIGVESKIITTFHGYDMSVFVVENGNKVYKDLFANGDLFLPISEHWKKKLIKLGCNEKKIVVHRMGINLENFRYFERKTQPEESIKILTIGRLVEKKGHEYMIEAMAKIVDKYRNIEYIIVGDGPLRMNLEGLVSELELNSYVKFLGAIEQKEVLEIYRQGHIFILPSITSSGGDQEGIPVVLMEAQACGLPVVSTYHSGIPEVVMNSKSGFLIPEKDVDTLAERIEYLIEHPKLWAEMGKAGRRFIEEKYDSKKSHKQLIEVYNALLENNTETFEKL